MQCSETGLADDIDPYCVILYNYQTFELPCISILHVNISCVMVFVSRELNVMHDVLSGSGNELSGLLSAALHLRTKQTSTPKHIYTYTQITPH
jgi:hypothetical protein